METFQELCNYWEVLDVNGMFFGDDYFGFPAVKHDVDKFVKLMGAELKHYQKSQWMIRKTENLKDTSCWKWIEE